MNILSHRGYWIEPSEKNSKAAFRRSFDLGFGTETDVRDYGGRLVISHDMPNGSEMDLKEFLAIAGNRTLPLAINIKSDGLVRPLKEIMANAGVADWFVFDMSIPDMRAYLQEDVPVFARMSEVEKESEWLDRADGIWLDAFSDTWYDATYIDALLKRGRRVCVVSSELHGRDHNALWKELVPISSRPGLMLCTDFPERAREFFEGSK